MHSPGATGQEEHDSQTLSTGVHLYCPSVSAGNPSPGHRIREVEDYTAEFNQYGRRLSTISLGEYVYGILLLCGLLIYDQQEQRRRRAGHYSARFHLNSMVWHICRFFGDWLHQNNLMLVGIFTGVALLVPTQISPMEYVSHHVGRLMLLALTASYWIHRQLSELTSTGIRQPNYLWAKLQLYHALLSDFSFSAARQTIISAAKGIGS
jgi:hypothetical protein